MTGLAVVPTFVANSQPSSLPALQVAGPAPTPALAQSAPSSLQLTDAVTSPPLPHAPKVDGAVDGEEPYTIKCVCGFPDDDGNTVLCETCNSWQHIECYYPTKNIPDVHKCLDCEPRPLDAKQATERQKRLREAPMAGDRKPKRPVPRIGRKKTKDSALPLPVNGMTNGHYQADAPSDQKSASVPRDQPPPAKKPKISHRNSSSFASLPSHPRQRSEVAGNGIGAGTGTGNGNGTGNEPNFGNGLTSPSQSPSLSSPNGGYFTALYSPEFMNLYRSGSDFQQIEANLYHDIGVTGTLSTWLKDPAVLAAATNGKIPSEVFQQYDGSLDEIQTPGIQLQTTEDASITVYGAHPTWRWLSVDQATVSGAFIGELKGQVGRKDDYVRDLANRWATLRHPEPFVFFPPYLPIYIDLRSEGNMFRYIRRSCNPNVRLNVLITENIIYHFCFIASRDIAAGEEITLGWEVDEDVHRLIYNSVSNGNIKTEGFQFADEQYISSWVTGVLANFGGCACDRSMRACVMDRFVRCNGSVQATDVLGNYSKAPKPRKTTTTRKVTKQISSPGPGQINTSRATNEAWNPADGEEMNCHSPSVSGSPGSRPDSRDLTPSTHMSVDTGGAAATGGAGLELSDRERRKLMQEEKLFEQLDNLGQQSHRKKKRNSAGSAVTTPGIISSARPHRLVPATQQHPGDDSVRRVLAASEPATPLGISIGSSRLVPGLLDFQDAESARTQAGEDVAQPSYPMASPPTRPSYANASTQTEDESTEQLAVRDTVKERKPFVSLAQQMLKRCHRMRLKHTGHVRTSHFSQAPEDLQMSPDNSDTTLAPLARDNGVQTREPSSPPTVVNKIQPVITSEDVEMINALDATTAPLAWKAQLTHSPEPMKDDPAHPPPALPQPLTTLLPQDPPSPPPPPLLSTLPSSPSSALDVHTIVKLEETTTLHQQLRVIVPTIPISSPKVQVMPSWPIPPPPPPPPPPPRPTHPPPQSPQQQGSATSNPPDINGSQSPLPPLLSPVVSDVDRVSALLPGGLNAAVVSPAVKRISFSDYLSRKSSAAGSSLPAQSLPPNSTSNARSSLSDASFPRSPDFGAGNTAIQAETNPGPASLSTESGGKITSVGDAVRKTEDVSGRSSLNSSA